MTVKNDTSKVKQIDDAMFNAYRARKKTLSPKPKRNVTANMNKVDSSNQTMPSISMTV